MFVNARNGFASENARRFRGCKRKMNNKRNVVLYLDKDLAEKTRELGFNLPKTFENHLKQLITQFSNVNSVDDSDSWSGFSSPGETGAHARIHTKLGFGETALFPLFLYSKCFSAGEAEGKAWLRVKQFPIFSLKI
jgi:hypothetical protein